MSSYTSSAGKLEVYMRLCVPHIITFVFLLLNISAVTFDIAQTLKPDFILIAVYYWAVYRPTLMLPAMIFVIGIIMDFLSGAPTGFYAMTYIAAHWITRDQRRFLMSQPFITVWLGFAFVSIAIGALQWVIYTIATMSLPEITPIILQLVSSICLFPLVVLTLFVAHRLLPGSPSRTL